MPLENRQRRGRTIWYKRYGRRVGADDLAVVDQERRDGGSVRAVAVAPFRLDGDLPNTQFGNLVSAAPFENQALKASFAIGALVLLGLSFLVVVIFVERLARSVVG